jgi:hypothetical protein
MKEDLLWTPQPSFAMLSTGEKSALGLQIKRAGFIDIHRC